MANNEFDIAIIGGGLSGLECGVFLSKEGYNVCVLDQGNIIGGCLQSFRYKSNVVDTGIHYVGSMGEGQIMNQYFKYLGIADKLNTVRLDDEFDIITFGDKKSYGYMGGYDRFISNLSEHFPSERSGIKKYCDKIAEIGNTICVDTHSKGKFTTGGSEALSISAVEYIKECIGNSVLQNILAGTNTLYGGTRDTANLYHHAMCNHSNIEGAYRFVGGTQQIADLLAEEIRKNGGTIKIRSKVSNIAMKSGEVDHLCLENGDEIRAKQYISTLHPLSTFSMMEKDSVIKQAYKTRLGLLPNSYGLFSVYVTFKDGMFPYMNKNHYMYAGDDVWDNMINGESLRPKTVLMSEQLESKGDKYSKVVNLMSPIDNGVFAGFEDRRFGKRGGEYYDLKEQIAENVIDFTSQYVPNLRDNMEGYVASTPLSYAHYTLSPGGTAYGILKDYNNSMATHFPTRTKVKNLFLSGQSINVHGAVGVSLTAASTCANFVGEEYLSKKISQA